MAPSTRRNSQRGMARSDTPFWASKSQPSPEALSQPMMVAIIWRANRRHRRNPFPIPSQRRSSIFWSSQCRWGRKTSRWWFGAVLRYSWRLLRRWRGNSYPRFPFLSRRSAIASRIPRHPCGIRTVQDEAGSLLWPVAPRTWAEYPWRGKRRAPCHFHQSLYVRIRRYPAW